ncbi:MAG: hypothetical protein CFE24_07550 [Flavobacterium sp. BFFFF2]|nr:MAG: hypothetical protein CFE24_07550 [Flavobacterium sp. BFFFF2]
MQTVHFVFVTPEFPFADNQNVGGIGTSVHQWVSLLTDLGFHCTVLVTGQATDGISNLNGFTLMTLRNPALKGLSDWLLRKKIQKKLIDIHQSNPITWVEFPDWLGLSAFVRVPFPIHIKIHGSDTLFCQMEQRKSKWRTRLFETVAFRGADKICAVSAFAGEKSKQLFSLKKQIDSIPNFVNRRPLTEVKPGRIVYLGSVVRKKGVLELAPVFNKLHQQFPEVELWIIGKDCADHTSHSPSTRHLVEQVLDSSARKKVYWKGALPHEVALNELARASILWFPSYVEALPMTWIEAMMLGRPMLVSNGGWATELVQHGHSALLVDPADHDAQFLALSRLLTDDSFRNDLGENAHHMWQQQFSPEAMVKNVLSKYILY